jgi:hypothetical protein
MTDDKTDSVVYVDRIVEIPVIKVEYVTITEYEIVQVDVPVYKEIEVRVVDIEPLIKEKKRTEHAYKMLRVSNILLGLMTLTAFVAMAV